ncbi:MAG: ABC transporter substrate-binding protein [Bacillota bacterium]|nr:ABC transporter substrate-binding protein [Bacillota bacterium]
MKKSLVTIFSFIIISLFTITGCGTTASTSGNKTADSKADNSKLQKVTIVLDWTPNTNHTGLYVAKEKGYFKDEGLDVDIEQPPEDGALSLLASGKAQFAISFQEEIATAITADNPLDVTAVAALIQHNTSGIISLKEKGISSPKHMENMRYATWDSPIEKAILKNVITTDGGDYSKVKMIPSTVTDVVSALKTNIDAVWIYYAQEGIACQESGLDTNFFLFKDINPTLDFYTPVLASSSKFLKENPEAAKKFLKAVAKGYEYAISNPEDAANILVKAVPELNKNMTVKSQEYLKDQYKAEVKEWGKIDQKRWDAFYSWLYDNKVLTKKIAPGQGFTNDYLPEK